MAEYIKLEAAIDAVTNVYYNTPDINLSAYKLEMSLRRIPAADVAPVVHGRWKPSGGLLECQNCGEIYSTRGGNEGKAWNYCPNCGARMDGDENG